MTKRLIWPRLPFDKSCVVQVDVTDESELVVFPDDIIKSVKSLSRKRLKVDVCDDRRHVLVTPLINEAMRVRFVVETVSGNSAVGRIRIDPV